MHCLALESEEASIKLKLSEVTKAVSSSKKMVVLTGAGISCNAGIPDFRSTNGLYSMVKAKHPNTVVKGKDLFDISLFRSETTLQVFATFMESLYGHTIQAMPTETHKFIKSLKKKNKLLRCYTQNIDAIERKLELNTGVIDEQIPNFRKHWKSLDVVQLHGDLNYLTCSNCLTHFNWAPEYREVLSNGEVPDCPSCVKNFNERIANGKRASSSTVGFLRPDIVLYGENHPNSESISKGLSMDIRSRPDCLIIFGTSLKVDGVKKLVKTLSKEVHEKNGKVIFVNKTKPSAAWNDLVDYFIETDCDSWVKYLRKELPSLFLTQVELDQLKLIKKQKQKAKNCKGSSKKEVLLTPPPTPSGKETSDVLVNPKSVKSNDKVKQFQNFKEVKEIPSPEFSPLKHDRVIDLSQDCEITNKIKRDLSELSAMKQKQSLHRVLGNKSLSPLKNSSLNVMTNKDAGPKERLTRSRSKVFRVTKPDLQNKENVKLDAN